MPKKTKKWPALKPCKHKTSRPNYIQTRGIELNKCPSELREGNLPTSAPKNCEVNDLLSQLSNDILVSILSSSLTTKEAARLSVLSHKWNEIWHSFPILDFEDKQATKRILCNNVSLCQEQLTFLRLVDDVVDKYVGPGVDEFRVTFDLDSSCQTHISKWVVFALEKNVRRLELDLSPLKKMIRGERNCTLPPVLPRLLERIKPSLTSLSLKYVNVTAEEIGSLLHWCPFLENLCVEGSLCMTVLRVFGSSLKHVEVSHCWKLEILDVHAPKLLSFTYLGRPIKLRIHDAPLLTEVSIGGLQDHLIYYAFDSFSNFSQLEYLSLQFFIGEMNFGINHVPALTNLKHLELRVFGMCDLSLLGWTPLIEACPVLEKLSLKMLCCYLPIPLRMVERDGCPLKCLKTFEINGYRGGNMDIEFATYVFKNALVLEEVVVDVIPLFGTRPMSKDTRITELERIMPEGVRLLVK